MRRRVGLIVALLLQVGCRAGPLSQPAVESSPTSTPPPPPPTPTKVVTGEPLATKGLSPVPTVTRFESSLATPSRPPTPETWAEPAPRPRPEEAVGAEGPRQVPNARRDFWVLAGESDGRRKITARLRVQTAHAAMWVEEGVWHDVRLLEGAAQLFETRTYVRNRAAFGSEWSPGIDNDPRVTILHATSLGEDILGYTSSLDEYPKSTFPQSNEAEMITVNLETVEIGTPSYDALLAREFAHLIQCNLDRNEERWVKEGLTELAAVLNGFDPDNLRQAYLQSPDVPFAPWTDATNQRGAALLFLSHFHQRFGDEGTRLLTAEPGNGVRGFESVLDKLGAQLTFDGLVTDWLATTYLDSVSEDKGSRYAYERFDLNRPEPSAFYDAYPAETHTTVHQLGADYVVLQGSGDIHIRFAGQKETSLLGGVSLGIKPIWWSNRADESLTSLTARFDLRGLQKAALSYRAWYDIEPRYDYVTVEISTDGGSRWHELPVPSGANANPCGSSPVWGYTGKSDGWVKEVIDISEYAGASILVRFRYVTDAAITGEGLLLDDVTITGGDPAQAVEIEVDEWKSDGFILTDGRVQQDFVVLLIGMGQEIFVERLPLDGDQSAEWDVPLKSRDLQEAVLVVTAIAPATHQPASYRLIVDQD